MINTKEEQSEDPMDRQLMEKRIVALLKYVQEAELGNLLQVVQEFAAEGMNNI